MLLVELRALRQICDTFKIFNLEEIGPSLCSASDNFGSDDFGEPAAVERFAEGSQDRGLDSENISDGLSSKSKRPVLNQRLQADGFHAGGGQERQILRGAVQDANFGDVDFISGLGARLLACCAENFHDVFCLEVMIAEKIGCDDTLCFTRTVPQDDERRLAQHA